jgi:putative membrane protein
LNVAGVGGGDDSSAAESVLLPVAPLAVARAIVARVLPGVDVESIPMRPAPARATRRSPIQGKRLAVGWNDAVFVSRRGRINGHLEVVPHARTQSVRVTQGPWERALGLATVHVDSTPGPVRIAGLHRDAAEARWIADAQADRARLARAVAGPQRWLASPPGSAAPPPPGPAPAPPPPQTPEATP